jgi:hypothetical protein
LYQANLLVVVRAVDKSIDITPFNFSQVHVYDYGGWDFDAFVRTIDSNITYIFCTSEIKRTRLIELLSFPSERVFVALPPVDVNLWSNKINDVKYQIVHIGNFKPIKEKDIVKERFNKIISDFETHVWGLGWQLNKDLYHGKTGVFNVSNIYANSKIALGLMYPFQREVTFSGRFWHAPLNGCMVFSEPGLYTLKIPGIIETDYTEEDIKKKLAIEIDRLALQKEAKKFWQSEFQKTIGIVSNAKIVATNENNLLKIKRYMIYKIIYITNFLRFKYQRLGIFELNIIFRRK